MTLTAARCNRAVVPATVLASMIVCGSAGPANGFYLSADAWVEAVSGVDDEHRLAEDDPSVITLLAESSIPTAQGALDASIATTYGLISGSVHGGEPVGNANAQGSWETDITVESLSLTPGTRARLRAGFEMISSNPYSYNSFQVYLNSFFVFDALPGSIARGETVLDTSVGETFTLRGDLGLSTFGGSTTARAVFYLRPITAGVSLRSSSGVPLPEVPELSSTLLIGLGIVLLGRRRRLGARDGRPRRLRAARRPRVIWMALD